MLSPALVTIKLSVMLFDESNDPPRVVNRGKEFVVRHREYIQDMYSASGTANSVSAFAIQGYPIQPGSFVTFPWLSSIADKFEQYRVEGMLFEYKSMYSDAVVTQNGSLGSIILATEYNSGAPAFSISRLWRIMNLLNRANHLVVCCIPSNAPVLNLY